MTAPPTTAKLALSRQIDDHKDFENQLWLCLSAEQPPLATRSIAVANTLILSALPDVSEDCVQNLARVQQIIRQPAASITLDAYASAFEANFPEIPIDQVPVVLARAADIWEMRRAIAPARSLRKAAVGFRPNGNKEVATRELLVLLHDILTQHAPSRAS